MKTLLLLKSPADKVQVQIHDSIYVPAGNVCMVPEGTEIHDPAEPYRKRIAQLEHELAKAKRGKKYIVTNLSGKSG